MAPRQILPMIKKTAQFEKPNIFNQDTLKKKLTMRNNLITCELFWRKPVMLLQEFIVFMYDFLTRDIISPIHNYCVLIERYIILN